jgi:hypothetical protein
MLKTLISILPLFYCTMCPAQNDSVNKSIDRHLNFKLSYNSSLIYPGISTGIEYPLQQYYVKKLKKQGKEKSFTKDRLIAGNLNWYHHPDFHDNIYVIAEWVMRRTNKKGFISEFSCGPGYSRTFIGGTTYRVDDNGNISVVKLAGYNYILISVGGGFGYDYFVKKQLPFSVFGKMNVISMFPYNSTIYLRPVLELGIRYMPGRTRTGSGNGSDSILK